MSFMSQEVLKKWVLRLLEDKDLDNEEKADRITLAVDFLWQNTRSDA